VRGLEFGRSVPAVIGRPPYDPRDLLKLYVYGYVNQVRSSIRCGRRTASPVRGRSAMLPGLDRRRDKRLFPDATGAASAEGWCQCQGFACSHPSLLLVAVIRTASGTRAASICASLTRSN